MTQPALQLQLPRGFHDVGPSRMLVQRELQDDWFRLGALAGYQAVEAPPVGFAATFTTGHHAAGERFYRFPDRRGRDLALAADSLPALLRLAHGRGLPTQRLSYCCPVFRYESKHRRHFHHLGLMEVQTRRASVAEQLRSVGRLAQTVASFLAPRCAATITVADTGLWRDLLQDFVPAELAATYLNELRQVPAGARHERLRADGAPAAIVDAARWLAADATTHDAPAGTPSAVVERVRGCHDLSHAIRGPGIDTFVDLSELHASEFHDGPSFVFRSAEGPVLGDGGTYSGFAATFTESESPRAAYAVVIGLERLVDVMAETTPLDAAVAADLAVLAAARQETSRHADRLTAELRAAGIAVWDAVLSMPIKHHLRELADLGINHSVIIGERELSATTYAVRDRTGALHLVDGDRLVDWLVARQVRPPVPST